jgi:hypothetical protein
VLAVAVVTGLAVQPFRAHDWTDPVGTVVYAAAAVGLVGVLLPRRGALLPGAAGTALACAVELFQLTGIPTQLAGSVPAVALLLGTGFAVSDLLWLVVGGVLATSVLGVETPHPTGRR